MQRLLHTPGQSCSVVCMGNCLALKHWLGGRGVWGVGTAAAGAESGEGVVDGLEREREREREREHEREREIEMVSLRSAAAELTAAVAGASVRAEAVVCGLQGGSGAGMGRGGRGDRGGREGELSEQEECVVVAEEWSCIEGLLAETGEMRERVVKLNSRVNVLLEEV